MYKIAAMIYFSFGLCFLAPFFVSLSLFTFFSKGKKQRLILTILTLDHERDLEIYQHNLFNRLNVHSKVTKVAADVGNALSNAGVRPR